MVNLYILAGVALLAFLAGTVAGAWWVVWQIDHGGRS
jgi:nitrogen fixation-related uncharacterized protein